MAPLLEGSIATGYLASDTLNPNQDTVVPAVTTGPPFPSLHLSKVQSDQPPQASTSVARNPRRRLSITQSEQDLDGSSSDDSDLADRHQKSQAIASSSKPYRKHPRINKGKEKAHQTDAILSKIDEISQSLVEADKPTPAPPTPLSMLTQALAALQESSDINRELIIPAVNFFRLDLTAAETFLALSDENRVMWLNSVLFQSSF